MFEVKMGSSNPSSRNVKTGMNNERELTHHQRNDEMFFTNYKLSENSKKREEQPRMIQFPKNNFVFQKHVLGQNHIQIQENTNNHQKTFHMYNSKPIQENLLVQTLNTERQLQKPPMESLKSTLPSALELAKMKQQFATNTVSNETSSPLRAGYGSTRVGGLARRRQNKIVISQNREMRQIQGIIEALNTSELTQPTPLESEEVRIENKATEEVVAKIEEKEIIPLENDYGVVAFEIREEKTPPPEPVVMQEIGTEPIEFPVEKKDFGN